MQLLKKHKFLLLITFIIAIGTFSGTAVCLEMQSDAFKDGGAIPVQYTGLGEDISPPLTWGFVPEGTQSFVLIMDDPDTPMGTWIHWVVYDIPKGSTGLDKNIPREFLLGDGTKQGINSFRWVGYGGPAPPAGPAHRYLFKLYALDSAIGLGGGSTKGAVIRAMQGHILAQAQIIGIFGRDMVKR